MSLCSKRLAKNPLHNEGDPYLNFALITEVIIVNKLYAKEKQLHNPFAPIRIGVYYKPAEKARRLPYPDL